MPEANRGVEGLYDMLQHLLQLVANGAELVDTEEVVQELREVVTGDVEVRILLPVRRLGCTTTTGSRL